MTYDRRDDLVARAASVLGWSFKAAEAVGLHGLRDLVRDRSRRLADDISRAIASGAYIVGSGRETTHENAARGRSRR